MLPHLPQGQQVTVRVEHGIITQNGGKGSRQTMAVLGVPYLQIDTNYCRDKAWVFEIDGFRERLEEARAKL